MLVSLLLPDENVLGPWMVNHIAPSIATVKLKIDHNTDARRSTRLLQNSNLIKGAFGREFPPHPRERERERERLMLTLVAP